MRIRSETAVTHPAVFVSFITIILKLKHFISLEDVDGIEWTVELRVVNATITTEGVDFGR
jgi:hypothetical protein